MTNIGTIKNLRKCLQKIRITGKSVAFVPTMGNLHEGHMHLLDLAQQSAQIVVFSIFVNPLQFGPNEDFINYPSTLSRDIQKLSDRGCDILFVPSVKEMYPDDILSATLVKVPYLSNIHCGLARSGHFTGVATVVVKLFGIVQPDIVVFGLKDFQQLLIAKQIVYDLCLPIKIIDAPIVRTKTGLAISSRNSYLNLAEKQKASLLYQTLFSMHKAIIDGKRNYIELSTNACKKLQQIGFVPEYLSICRQKDLKLAVNSDRNLVILAACYLGKTRLIDNIQINLID